MSASSPGVAVFQPPPNWGVKSWAKGQTGNPGGVSRHLKLLRQAVEEQETPERVCAVLDAMQKAALNGDANAAKVYLKAVGIEMSDSERITKAVVALFEAKLAEARDRLVIEAQSEVK